jgi:hypothetical protein
MQPLTRDSFREGTFKRDNHKCVICGAPAVDAHHILERRLWPDGGYYLDNGASLCQHHHIEAEMTTLSVEQVRQAAGITRKILPPHLYDDHVYDKWGNPILASGQRQKGELFYDESVQKILKAGSVLDQFTDYVKFPRTYHLPWSEGMTNDDRQIKSMENFIDKEVVVTIKMDGENTTMYRDHIHARSMDSANHPSRNWVKNFWSTFAHEIPVGMRICGENLYAKHSIGYEGLPSYFMGFHLWLMDVCVNWDETLEWFQLLGITPVQVLYEGVYDEKKIRSLWDAKDWESCEGYVMRLRRGFRYGDYRNSVGKFVRKGHIQTIKHWMHGQAIIPNKLKD